MERRPLAVVTAAGIDQVGAVTWAGAGTYVVPDPPSSSSRYESSAEGAAATVHRLRPGLMVTAHAAHGDPRDSLVELSRKRTSWWSAPAVAAHVRSRMLGSVSTSVARHAHRPSSSAARTLLVSSARACWSGSVAPPRSSRCWVRLPARLDARSPPEGPALLPRRLRGHVRRARRGGLRRAPRGTTLLAEAVAGYSEKYPEVPVDFEIRPRPRPRDRWQPTRRTGTSSWWDATRPTRWVASCPPPWPPPSSSTPARRWQSCPSLRGLSPAGPPARDQGPARAGCPRPCRSRPPDDWLVTRTNTDSSHSGPAGPTTRRP